MMVDDSMVERDPMEARDPVELWLSDGTRRCKAWSRQAQRQCARAATPGMEVCASHGSKSPQARRKAALKLLELVDPAIATLAREMVQADKSNDRQAAANSILDRSGYGRTSKIETEDAREILRERLIEIRNRTQEDPSDDPDD